MHVHCLHSLHTPHKRNNAYVMQMACSSALFVVTSSILKFAGLTQFFGGAYRGRVFVRAFIGVSGRSYMWISVSVTGSHKKKYIRLNKDGKNLVLIRLVFHFCLPVSVRVRGFLTHFCGILFLPEIDLYLFYFYPIFSLYEICLKMDMFINLLITNYAC